jgi:hypothetical protein
MFVARVCLCVRAPYRCRGAAMNVKFTGQCLYSNSTSPLANILRMSGFVYHMYLFCNHIPS